jgi:methyl-accepting chemotaxis protein
MATASEQQSATSEEINRSMEQVASISAETAQGMAQSAHAVAELSRQTQVLQNLVNDLKGDKDHVSPGARRAVTSSTNSLLARR